MRAPLSVLWLLTDGLFLKLGVAFTAGLGLAAAVLPRFVQKARESAAAAGISVFWLWVPSMIGVALLIATDSPGNPLAPFVALATLIAQVIFTVRVLYRHRRWPWIAIPMALVPLMWWATLIAAIVVGGLMGGH